MQLMLRVRAIALIIFGLSVVPTFAQTASELERSYGQPVAVDSAASFYSVSQHIWMSPNYAADGQVCRLRLYPKHLGRKTGYLSGQLLFSGFVRVLNQMTPPHLRGSKKDDFGTSTLGGGIAWTTYGYENVSFNFISFYKLDPDIVKKAEAAVLTGFDPVELPVQKKTLPSLNDFAASEKVSTEIVVISWNHRPCKLPSTPHRITHNTSVCIECGRLSSSAAWPSIHR